MYIFDTNIIIEFLRGRLPLGLELLKNTDARLIKIPSIVKAELLVGANKSKDVEKARKAVEEFLVNFEITPFDDQCAVFYAKLRAELELAGKKIESNDLIIAATVLAYDATLATNDINDFGRVPGLKLMSLSDIELQ